MDRRQCSRREHRPLDAFLSAFSHEAMPISGYVFVIAGDYPLTYFGLADAPRLLAKDKALSDLAETVHLSLQYAIYAVVLMHAGAALHHYFFRRNDVLQRMLPSLRR